MLMDLNFLKKLVKKGEGTQLEFKKKVANTQKILKEVVAFANTKGGLLLIGVDDNKTLSGLKYPEEDALIMTQAIIDSCRPKVSFSLESVTLNNGKEVLAFDVKESKKKPVFLANKPKGYFGKAYVRVEDKSIQSSIEVRRILKGLSINKSFPISIGDLEQSIIKAIYDEGFTSISKISDTFNLPYTKASNLLVKLTISNILKIRPKEKEDQFFLSEPSI